MNRSQLKIAMFCEHMSEMRYGNTMRDVYYAEHFIWTEIARNYPMLGSHLRLSDLTELAEPLRKPFLLSLYCDTCTDYGIWSRIHNTVTLSQILEHGHVLIDNAVLTYAKLIFDNPIEETHDRNEAITSVRNAEVEATGKFVPFTVDNLEEDYEGLYDPEEVKERVTQYLRESFNAKLFREGWFGAEDSNQVSLTGNIRPFPKDPLVGVYPILLQAAIYAYRELGMDPTLDAIYKTIMEVTEEYSITQFLDSPTKYNKVLIQNVFTKIQKA